MLLQQWVGWQTCWLAAIAYHLLSLPFALPRPAYLVQAIFKKTPHDKQVMMFSATLSTDIRPVCKKFMRDVRPWASAGGGGHTWPAQTRLQCGCWLPLGTATACVRCPALCGQGWPTCLQRHRPAA